MKITYRIYRRRLDGTGSTEPVADRCSEQEALEEVQRLNANSRGWRFFYMELED